MRLHRFYIEEDLKTSDDFTLRDEGVIHQLRDVFRLGKGDKVIFFDGDGFDYTYVIVEISKKEISLKKESVVKNFIPEQKVTLLMSFIKKENFELVLEKCTELGVTNFVPIITERTISKNLNFDRARKILKEASEQCGRGDLPILGETKTLEEALNEYKNIIAFNMDGESLQALSPKLLGYELLIGPEGGWSEKEIEMLKNNKIKIFKLGDTTLRAETAAIVASAFLMRN